MSDLDVPKREYDKFIDAQIRNKGVAKMLKGIDERNAQRKAAEQRAAKTRRDGIVSDFYHGGLRGWGRWLGQLPKLSAAERMASIERAKLRAGKRTYRWDQGGRMVLLKVNGREATPEEVEEDALDQLIQGEKSWLRKKWFRLRNAATKWWSSFSKKWTRTATSRTWWSSSMKAKSSA